MWKNPLERERIARMICSELNNFVDLKMCLTFLMQKVQELTGCEAVGIRLEDNDDYPYYAYCGFSEGFIRKENSLCSKDNKGERIKDPDGNSYLLECMCGNIIRGRFDPQYDFFTTGGSFWSNHTSDLIANTTDEERQTRTRNYCNSCGYESVALIPIQARGEKIGLLQFNDHRPDMFSLELIEFLEMICENTGLAIQNSRIYHNLLLSREAGSRSDESSRQKSAFLANMSHEIRTPLNGIIGMTQLLQDCDLREDEKELVEIIAESSDKLLHLLNNILDLSKIEAGKMEVQEELFDLEGLLRELCLTYSMLARQKGLNFSFVKDEDVPRKVYGDAGKLKEVLENMLNNSLKFTDAGEIRMLVRHVAPEKTGYCSLFFSIEDTGIGIKAEDMAHLFDAFYQTRSSIRNNKGTGLGLPICKQLTDMMGGRIEIESKPGFGSSFRVHLVLRREVVRKNSASASSKSVVPNGHSYEVGDLRLLLVDDDEINHAVMRMFLKNNHIQFDIAVDGRKALRMMEEKQYDLLLLDISLPDMDGTDVLAMLREQETKSERKHLPVIVVTAHTMEGDRERFLAAGADEYIAKPINLNQLLGLIRKITEKH